MLYLNQIIVFFLQVLSAGWLENILGKRMVFLKQINPTIKNGFYIMLFVVSLMGLATGTYNPFIYFRF